MHGVPDQLRVLTAWYGCGLGNWAARQDVKEDILADIEWFLGAKKWYKDRGVPYRRGVMRARWCSRWCSARRLSHFA